jgi:hypothetical protein
MASVQPRKKTVSTDTLVRHLQALGEKPFPATVEFRPPNGDWNPEKGGGGLRSWHRRCQNVWLTRNEGERRIGAMLGVGGYFHGLMSFLLFHGLVARLPAEGLPLWIRLQPWAGFALGLLLAVGGVGSLFLARNFLESARRIFSFYLLFFMMDGLWVLQSAARPSAMGYPLAAGLLIFFTIRSARNLALPGFFGRRRRLYP